MATCTPTETPAPGPTFRIKLPLNVTRNLQTIADNSNTPWHVYFLLGLSILTYFTDPGRRILLAILHFVASISVIPIITWVIFPLHNLIREKWEWYGTKTPEAKWGDATKDAATLNQEVCY